MGVLCVEFSCCKTAARGQRDRPAPPHNSGHYSQNACDVSQFELQVRTMARLPLTQPRQHSPPSCSTCWATCGLPTARRADPRPGPRCWPLPGTHLHLYGKRDAKRGRKMGHLNITAATPAGSARAPP